MQEKHTVRQNHSSGSGKLFVVATPIGNLQDLSPRAVQVLQSVDEILVEDTRHFANLARAFDIVTPTKSYHEHNELRQAQRAVEQMLAGQNMALVSDAGTPTINDPGYRIINACHAAGVTVATLPGPCAAIAALSISGFETHAFFYAGFLATKSGRKRSQLREAVGRDHPTIFYESPQRVAKTLDMLALEAPESDVFVVREMTKVYEEYFRGTARDASAWIQQRTLKGEFVLIVRGEDRREVRRKRETSEAT